MLKADDPYTYGFPSRSSDITISKRGIDASRSKSWRDRDAFGGMKRSKNQGPKPVITDMIPTIVIQSADYARLFMSFQPFMLFCVDVLHSEVLLQTWNSHSALINPRVTITNKRHRPPEQI